MACNFWHFQRALAAGLLAMLVLTPLAIDAQAPLGSPSTKPSGPTKGRFRGGDRGYDFNYQHHPDLSSISKTIHTLTRELKALLLIGHASGFASFTSLEVLQKLDELRVAVRARRQMQMALVLEEAVNEMIKEEAAAARGGREPTSQTVEQAVDKADKKIDDKRQQLETTPAVEPGSRSGNNPPQDAEPTIEQSARASAAGALNRALQIIDNPDSLIYSRNRTDPSKAVADVKKGVEKLVDLRRNILGGEAGPVYEAELRKALDPVIQELEKREQEGTAWLEAGARLIQTTPTTPAERAENEARQTWRQDYEVLKAGLATTERNLRNAKRALAKDQNATNRSDYEGVLHAHTKTIEMLRSHLSKQPD